MYNEILRYMGYKGTADTAMENLISSCLEKLAVVSTPRYVTKLIPCKVAGEHEVNLDTLNIKSRELSAHLCDCESAYFFAATLGASVDRLIAQRSVIDSAEAFCLQACAAAKIEEYCDNIENELLTDAEKHGLFITSRFSPGYGDFNIEHQQDILRMLNAQKQIGVTETKSHMLSPLKTVTAVIGLKKIKNTDEHGVINRINSCNAMEKIKNCDKCNKLDCQFRITKGNLND